jgi:uncharacterized Zn finger protein (UPF0148 family)
VAPDRPDLTYGGCPRCGLIVRRDDASEDGAVTCPDCAREGVKVAMQLTALEPQPGPGD